MSCQRGQTTITALSEPVLVNIFQFLPSEDLHKMPLICTQWSNLLDTQEADKLFADVKVSLSEHPANSNETAGMYAWFLKRPNAVRTLTVELYTNQAYVPFAAILGLIGRGLTGLKVLDFSDEGPMHIKDVSWLKFTPNLMSLELEESFNKSIMKAELPKGLKHLSLSSTSENFATPMTRIPSALSTLSQLTSLSLATSHTDFEFSRLADLKTLQSLDLSNSAIASVPAEVARLPDLTALRLNNCFVAAASSHGLSVLSQLTKLKLLEMRDCQLKSVPSEIIGLTSLKKLLLGYNNFTEGGDYFPPILPGAYLENLELLALSDTMQEPVPIDQALIEPLSCATKLKTLRINRNWGLALTNKAIGNFLKNKPDFETLEYSEDMASEVVFEPLIENWPGVRFLARD